VSAKPGDEAGTGCLRENISMDYHITGSKRAHRLPESAGELSIREQSSEAGESLPAAGCGECGAEAMRIRLRQRSRKLEFLGYKEDQIHNDIETPPPIAS
jgi:hypothetical protein